MLILASQSPRRQELLRAAGIEFRAVRPDGEPRAPGSARGRYADLVRRAALAKALSVAQRERGLILGADTIVVCGGQVMGKPAGKAEAREMLWALSDRWQSVYTGLALVCGSRHTVGYERTKVAFCRLSKKQIEWYVSTGEPMDKAGAYAIQGEGAALVRAIRGCYTNVIGLPLPRLMEMLSRFREGSRSGDRAQRGGC